MSSLVRSSVAVLVLAAAATGCAARGLEARLDASVADLVKQVPGATMLVERGGVIVFDKSYGLSDLENPLPMTAASVYCIGSISKQFGAAAIFQLVEAGKLSLDDPLSRFYPDFPRAARIKIHDLLNHTSGIADLEYEGTWPKTMGVARTDEEVIAVFRDLPPAFEPGARWSYSTSNYFLLGMIVEKISGKPLAEYLKTNIFDRAGLRDTRFCDAHQLIPHRARGYDEGAQEGHFVPTRFVELTEFGIGGGLCSTARDLLAWQHALEEGRVISANSYQLMSTPHPLPDGTPTGYGYGLFPSQFAGHLLIGHSGGVAGYSAMLNHYPRDDVRIVVMTNTEDAPLYGMERGLATVLLGVPPPIAKPIPVAELSRYTVSVPFAPSTIRFIVEGDHLSAQFSDEGSKPIPLELVDDDTFESHSRSLRVRFTTANGRVTQAEVYFGGMTFYQRY